MFLTMGVSLFTSRIVLNTLGIEDFGTYNLVAAIVVMFSFINNAMLGTTQRFLNYEMAKNSNGAVHKVFCVSMNVHLLIMLIIVFLSETIGLWFLNFKLNIPIERMQAANIVYQFSLLTFCFSVLKAPYNASVIAYEKMSFYAGISIVEVVLKALIVYLLLLFAFDKLILYAILVFAVSILLFLAYRYFCRQLFPACHYRYVKDRKLFKELVGFSSWSMFGNLALMGSSQGVFMILNVFLGVTINAAMAIATQVNLAVFSFVSNFQLAFNPQIIKTFASGDLKAHQKLVFQASKFSYYLLFILVLPILFNTTYILQLWLKIVPEYAIPFTQLILIFSLIDALAGPFWVSMYATGEIKKYQIGVALILFLNLPIAYLLLKQGFSPIYVIVGKIILNFILFLFRLLMIQKHIKFSLIKVIKDVYLQVIFVSTVSILSLFYIKKLVVLEAFNFTDVAVFTGISVLVIGSYIGVFGLSKEEKIKIYSLLKKKIK
ncbi:lipopolysaccharide biosynthesis protein [Polaribacter sp. IC066]|uniref:lipopolysaccharide biosynthesis protein n=1 Tax=Polaribacter sp. IC066 TaxID=57032 RepID=UPI0011C279CF|nr:lipopolysaccharide biosynthesis protein [Polaribacter sp. IC066]TXD56695.1 lipopolysaccharide biosynthesis protein [Polaribacter sp. IC066]